MRTITDSAGVQWTVFEVRKQGGGTGAVVVSAGGVRERMALLRVGREQAPADADSRALARIRRRRAAAVARPGASRSTRSGTSSSRKQRRRRRVDCLGRFGASPLSDRAIYTPRRAACTRAARRRSARAARASNRLRRACDESEFEIFKAFDHFRAEVFRARVSSSARGLVPTSSSTPSTQRKRSGREGMVIGVTPVDCFGGRGVSPRAGTLRARAERLRVRAVLVVRFAAVEGLRQHAVFQVKHAVGVGDDARVVGHHQDRRAAVVGGRSQQLDHLLAVRPVQGAGRLVGEAERRLLDRAPGRWPRAASRRRTVRAGRRCAFLPRPSRSSISSARRRASRGATPSPQRSTISSCCRAVSAGNRL